MLHVLVSQMVGGSWEGCGLKTLSTNNIVKNEAANQA